MLFLKRLVDPDILLLFSEDFFSSIVNIQIGINKIVLIIN